MPRFGRSSGASSSAGASTATRHLFRMASLLTQWRHALQRRRRPQAGQPGGAKRSGLADVIIISTRYFGGILLGAPGLVRAYTQSAADTLEAAPKVELMPCQVYSCTFDFSSWARVQTPLTQAGYVVDDISYTDAVRVRFLIQQGMEDRFLNHVQNLTQGQTVPEYTGAHMMENDI